MHRRNTLTCLSIGFLVTVASGCASTSSPSTVIDTHAFVALGTFGDDSEQSTQRPDIHSLGAGDALGHSIYNFYLTHYGAAQNERMAGVQSDGHLID